jgi:trigger factor
LEIKVRKLNSVEREVEVFLTPKEVDPIRNRIQQDWKERAEIPGFRKGKVPMELVLRRYKEEIERDIKDSLVSFFYRRAIAEAKLVPLTPPLLLDAKLEIDGSGYFKLKVEEKPKVKIGKYKGIKAEKKIEDVKEEEVNNVLEDLKRERTRWVDVDREAKEGDFLILDLEVYLKDKLVEKKENMGVLLDKGSLIPDMFENLVGMKKEEEKEFEVELPDDYRDEKLAGKRCKFKVKVKSIKQKEEPSLDDGFAKEIGDYKNLDELKEKIKEELKRYKERQAELDFEEKIIDRLIENSEMELPPQLLEIQTRKIAEDMIMRLIYSGIPRM